MTDKLSNTKMPDGKLSEHQYFKGYKTLSSAVKYIPLKLLCMNHSFFVWFTCIVMISWKTEGGDRKAQGAPVLPAGPLKSSQFIRKALERLPYLKLIILESSFLCSLSV